MWHESDRHAQRGYAAAWDGCDQPELATFLVALAVGNVSVEEGMTIIDVMALVIVLGLLASIWIVWRNL